MLVSIVQYLLYPTRIFWQEKVAASSIGSDKIVCHLSYNTTLADSRISAKRKAGHSNLAKSESGFLADLIQKESDDKQRPQGNSDDSVGTFASFVLKKNHNNADRVINGEG